MSKLKTLIKSIKIANDALEALGNEGVDIDRLIRISNAQGPQGKAIQELLRRSDELQQLLPPDTPVAAREDIANAFKLLKAQHEGDSETSSSSKSKKSKKTTNKR